MARVCAFCGAELPENSRSDRRTCNDSHRTLFNRWRAKRNKKIEDKKAWVLQYVREADTPEKRTHTLRHLNALESAVQAAKDDLFAMAEND